MRAFWLLLALWPLPTRCRIRTERQLMKKAPVAPPTISPSPASFELLTGETAEPTTAAFGVIQHSLPTTLPTQAPIPVLSMSFSLSSTDNTSGAAELLEILLEFLCRATDIAVLKQMVDQCEVTSNRSSSIEGDSASVRLRTGVSSQTEWIEWTVSYKVVEIGSRYELMDNSLSPLETLQQVTQLALDVELMDGSIDNALQEHMLNNTRASPVGKESEYFAHPNTETEQESHALRNVGYVLLATTLSIFTILTLLARRRRQRLDQLSKEPLEATESESVIILLPSHINNTLQNQTQEPAPSSQSFHSSMSASSLLSSILSLSPIGRRSSWHDDSRSIAPSELSMDNALQPPSLHEETLPSVASRISAWRGHLAATSTTKADQRPMAQASPKISSLIRQFETKAEQSLIVGGSREPREHPWGAPKVSPSQTNMFGSFHTVEIQSFSKAPPLTLPTSSLRMVQKGKTSKLAEQVAANEVSELSMSRIESEEESLEDCHLRTAELPIDTDAETTVDASVDSKDLAASNTQSSGKSSEADHKDTRLGNNWIALIPEPPSKSGEEKKDDYDDEPAVV